MVYSMLIVSIADNTTDTNAEDGIGKQEPRNINNNQVIAKYYQHIMCAFVFSLRMRRINIDNQIIVNMSWGCTYNIYSNGSGDKYMVASSNIRYL